MALTAFDADAYTRDARENWSSAAPHYERISASYFGPVTDAFLRFAGIAEGDSVLDLACGPGTATLAAARMVRDAGRVTGCDLAPGMIELASRRARDAGLANISWKEANAESLDFPAATFDAVICQLGLMLFARPDAALREMMRVGKKGATVACLVQGIPERMLFTSLPMKCALKHAPQPKVPGAPTVYSFGPEGALEFSFHRAGLSAIGIVRKKGVFAFASAEEYWEILTAGGGRMRALLATLEPPVVSAIRRDVLAEAAAFRSGTGVEIPYEFVIAKGLCPS